MSDEVCTEIKNLIPGEDGDTRIQAPLHLTGQQTCSPQPGIDSETEYYQPLATNFGSEALETQQETQACYLHEKRDEPTLREMQNEVASLREINAQLDALQQETWGGADIEDFDLDSKSVYVGNVDYGSTPVEVQQHFSSNGVVERVTIMSNKQTGKPKGFAFLEFALADNANKAVATLDGSIFRGRELKVTLKRTNIPGFSTTGRGMFRERGRGFMRGRGGSRGHGFMRGRPRFSPY